MTTIDIEFDKQIDNSRVHRVPDPLCSLEYLGLTLLGAMFVFGALFYGWQQYQWIQYGYRIEESQRRIEELSEVGRQLRVERGVWASPRRIDETARRELGMVRPRVGQIVTFEAGYAATEAGIAASNEPSAMVETQLAQRIDD